MGRRIVVGFVGAILLVLTISGSLWAQVSRGTILGTVTDESGGVVPNAKITVTNRETGLQREITTSGAGFYEVVALPVGEYKVEAEATGFERVTREALHLDVEQHLRIDILLRPGTLTQTVTVTGQAPLVEGDSSSHGQVIGARTIVDLPLNGRDFMVLPLLSTGVNVGQPGNPQSYYFDNTVAANGNPADKNEYYVDGNRATVALDSLPGTRLSVDSLQEFKVMTSGYTAEFGGKSGIQMNIITKSGTDALHGSAYEFIRNDKLDARNFFALSRPPYKRNNFGGTIGGPILKEKLFFYADYEGTRIREGVQRSAHIPSPAEMAGDFSADPQVYNPFSTHPDPSNPGQVIRDPIPGNLLANVHALDPISQQVMKTYLPAPNASGYLNYRVSGSLTDDLDDYSGRIDYNVNSKSLLFGRYSISTRPRYNPGTFPLVGGDRQLIRPQAVALNYTYSLSPVTLVELTGGYSRFIANFYQQNNQGVNIAGNLGIKGTSPDPFTEAVPIFSVSGANGFYLGDGGYRPNVETDNQFQYTAKLTHRVGSHSLKFGVDFRHDKWHQFTDAEFNGYFAYTGQYTSQHSSGTGGNGLAEFLWGYPGVAAVSGGVGEDRVRMASWSIYPFFTADWKATPNLTINYGLRWEYNSPWLEERDRWASFDLATGAVIYPATADLKILQGASLPFPTETVNRRNEYAPTYTNWAPRFGFAYRPLGSNKTAIRGGIGLFYNDPFSVDMLNVGGNYPWRQTRSVSADPINIDPTLNTANILVSSKFPTLPGLNFSLDQKRRESIETGWSFGVQRQLPWDVMVDASYQGNKSTHNLIYGDPVNQPLPGPGPIQPRRPYPLYSGLSGYFTDGFSSYNALQLRVEKRLAKDLGFLSSYTFGKTLDDSEGFNGAFFSNPDRIKSLGGMNQKHIFTTAFNYLLPVGNGRPWGGNMHGVEQAFLGGWQVTGIVTLDGGYPFSAYLSADVANCGCTNFPNRIGNGNLPASERTLSRWFDTSAFTIPATFTRGNSAPYILTGPGYRNLDLGIMKNFRIKERDNIQFRFESFNSLNHTTFGNPYPYVDIPSLAGLITSANPAREVQFALKWTF